MLVWRTVHRPYYIWSTKFKAWTEYVDKTEAICFDCDAHWNPTKYSSGIFRAARNDATHWRSTIYEKARTHFGDHAVDEHGADEHGHAVDEHGADDHGAEIIDDDAVDDPEYRPWLSIYCVNCGDECYPQYVTPADNHQFCTHCGSKLKVHSYEDSDEDDGIDPNQKITLRCERCDEYYDDYYDYDDSPVAIATTTTITTTTTTIGAMRNGPLHKQITHGSSATSAARRLRSTPMSIASTISLAIPASMAITVTIIRVKILTMKRVVPNPFDLVECITVS